MAIAEKVKFPFASVEVFPTLLEFRLNVTFTPLVAGLTLPEIVTGLAVKLATTEEPFTVTEELAGVKEKPGFVGATV